jgi:hypothetical protein
VPADDKTVVFGIDEPEGIAATVRSVAKGEAGLANTLGVQQTLKLIDPLPSWAGIASPKGCMAWLGRLYNKLLNPLGPGAPALPEFPDTPPLGFALSLVDDRISGEVAWPADTLRGLAAYIKKLQDSF